MNTRGSVREHARWEEHRTEVTEVTEGGIGDLVGEFGWVDTGGFRAGTREWG